MVYGHTAYARQCMLGRSKVLENGIVTSFTITLTNNDDRTIHLKPGSLYRVTVDGDETTTEKIGEDSVTKDLKSGESHTASFSQDPMGGEQGNGGIGICFRLYRADREIHVGE